MEGDSTTEPNYTEEELRDAGASATFIAYYQTAKEMGEQTNAVAHLESEHRTLEEVAESPYAGGGFFKALWNATFRYPNNSENPYGADSTNKRILQEAGVYVSGDSLIA